MKGKSSMVLAGDIGGTKTLLGLFDAGSSRPKVVSRRSFVTLDYDDLAPMIADFMRDLPLASRAVETACFGVAGPVINGTSKLTNVPWVVDARRIAEHFGLARADLLNDLQAMAHGLQLLDESEIHVLQPGHAVPGGSIGLIAAGTGLGVATLHQVDGRYVPAPSEGGHADFAARNDREIGLLRWLTERHGRAEVEAVVSGRGLLNIHQVTHGTPCPAVRDLSDPDAAAEITAAGLARRCAGCVEALEMFVDAYGAEAGNHALRAVSTGGLFVGGGIAPKILPALTDGRFLQAFRRKAPFEALLSTMPVRVVLNPETGLLGAAAYASRELETSHTAPPRVT